MNIERNSFGELCFDENLAALDATSAMSLSTPAIEMVSSGEALWTCCRSASARHRWLPAVDLADDSLVAHDTAGVLSHKIPTCACVRGTGLMFSSTSQPSKTPAISRSEIGIVPLRLEAETNLSCISFGHSCFHTVASIV